MLGGHAACAPPTLVEPAALPWHEPFPMNVRNPALALGAFGILFGSTAHSQESTSSSAPSVLTVRAGLPFTGIVGSERFSAIKLGGLSTSLRLFDLAEAEVVVPFWINPCDHGPSYGARIGISPSLVALPATRTGWNIRVPALAGYDFYVLTGGGCEYEPDSRMHVVTAATGLDFAYFWSPDAGVSFRALGFAGNSWYRELSAINGRPFDTVGITDSMLLWGATFDVGIAVGF